MLSISSVMIGLFCFVFASKLPPSRIIYDECRTLSASSVADDIQDLSDVLSSTYQSRGVAGVLDYCQRTKLLKAWPPQDLVKASLSISDKGTASAILNALIGSCCLIKSNMTVKDHEAATLALDLFHSYDDAIETLRPDVVTLALTYTAAFQEYPKIAAEILSQSQQLRVDRQSLVEHQSNNTCKEIIDFLVDNEHFCILNKPSGVVLYNPPLEPSIRKKGKLSRSRVPDLSLEQILQQKQQHDGKRMNLSSMNPNGSKGFVHRLDRGTSGCLVVAKTNSWHARLMTQFFLHRVQKSYIALVYTNNHNNHNNDTTVIPNHGQIDLPIDGRPAQSSFVVLERYGNLAAKLKVTTRQGRKHQVRIHCSRGLRAPIILDPLYGGEAIMYHFSSQSNNNNNDSSSSLSSKKSIFQQCRAQHRFCLHADTLSIPDLDIHNVQAPMPDWWTDILEAIIQEM